jgi:hypothetical protein
VEESIAVSCSAFWGIVILCLEEGSEDIHIEPELKRLLSSFLFSCMELLVCTVLGVEFFIFIFLFFLLFKMELFNWLYIIPAGAIGLLSLLFMFQHKLLYFPDVPAGYRTKMLNPTDFGLPEPESHMLQMRDGVKVHVWLFIHSANSRPSKQMAGSGIATRPTVVFYHGNAGNMSFRNDNFRALFLECGANVVAVEYRGFGMSEGEEFSFCSSSHNFYDQELRRRMICGRMRPRFWTGCCSEMIWTNRVCLSWEEVLEEQ